MSTYFKTDTDIAPNLIDDFLANFWLSEEFSTGRISSETKKVGAGLIPEKTEALYAELKKERKQPPVVILQQMIFYNIFILWLWLRIITRSNQGV